MDRYQISEVNLGKTKYICFELFEVLSFKFFFKRGNQEEHPYQNVTELVHYIILFYTQELDCGRSFTYNRKRSGPRIKPCSTPYCNVPALEKTSIQTKNFLFER